MVCPLFPILSPAPTNNRLHTHQQPPSFAKPQTQPTCNAASQPTAPRRIRRAIARIRTRDAIPRILGVFKRGCSLLILNLEGVG